MPRYPRGFVPRTLSLPSGGVPFESQTVRVEDFLVRGEFLRLRELLDLRLRELLEELVQMLEHGLHVVLKGGHPIVLRAEPVLLLDEVLHLLLEFRDPEFEVSHLCVRGLNGDLRRTSPHRGDLDPPPDIVLLGGDLTRPVLDPLDHLGQPGLAAVEVALPLAEPIEHGPELVLTPSQVRLPLLDLGLLLLPPFELLAERLHAPFQ